MPNSTPDDSLLPEHPHEWFAQVHDEPSDYQRPNYPQNTTVNPIPAASPRWFTRN